MKNNYRQVILLGRGTTGCYGEMNPVTFENKANKFAIAEGNYLATMANVTSQLIKKILASGKNAEMYVPESIALKAAQVYGKCGKGQDVDMEIFAAFPSAMNDEKLKNSIIDLCQSVKDCITARIERKQYVDIKSVSMMGKAELIVPEGVTLQEGQELNFVNGKTEDGITVRGWGETFNRTKMLVESRTVGNRKVFYISINSKQKGDILLNAMTKQMWAQCPEVDYAANFKLNIVESEKAA
jgi:hypothetical protein